MILNYRTDDVKQRWNNEQTFDVKNTNPTN